MTVQTTTYVLNPDNSIIAFDSTTNINVAGGDGIWGGNEATSWVVNTKGSVTGTTGVELDFISAFTNQGVITGTGAQAAGVSMTGGGLFTNAVGSAIHGAGAMSWGVTMGVTGGGYGSVDNTFSNNGLIDGAHGGVELAGSTKVGNGGTIHGGSVGLLMNGGGVLTNSGAIIGSASTGAYFGGTTTVFDSGTITGGTNAVQFAGTGANALTLQPGAVVNGNLVGSTAAGATTALTLKGSGEINGSIQHFTSVADQSGTWVLDGVSSLGPFTVQSGAVLQVGDSSHSAASLTLTSLQNSGTVQVGAGTLDVQNLTGGGGAFILGGTLEIGASSHGTVTFGGATGLLQLDQSQTYGGTVAGFASAGSAIDLRDIGFVNANEATYKSGTLTVSDGSHTAKIALAGSFSGSAFVAQSDGHGGTLVFDPAASTNAALTDLLHSSLGVSLI